MRASLGGFAEVGPTRPDGAGRCRRCRVEDLDRARSPARSNETGTAHRKTAARQLKLDKLDHAARSVQAGRPAFDRHGDAADLRVHRSSSTDRRLSGQSEQRSLLRELGEFLDDPLVGRPLERHDQVGQRFQSAPSAIRRIPACGRRPVRDVDLAVLAGEAQRVPFLLLAAIFAVPGLADDFTRDVVGAAIPSISPSFSTDVMLVSS